MYGAVGTLTTASLYEGCDDNSIVQVPRTLLALIQKARDPHSFRETLDNFARWRAAHY